MISVIIPLYNAARFIEETLRSVQGQTYQDWECIVVDDGSTDNSADIVCSISQTDNRIKYICQTNAGPSAARNNGMKLAKGDYIQFLDADDWFPPDRFEKMLKAYQDVKDNVILLSKICLGSEHDIHRHSEYSKNKFNSDFDFKQLYGGFGYDFAFIPGAVLFRRSFLENVSWNEEMKASEDWDYYLQLANKGYIFRQIDEELFVYRVVRGSLSNNSLLIYKTNFVILQRYYRKGLFLKVLWRTTGVVYSNLLSIKHHRTTKLIVPHFSWQMFLCWLMLPIMILLYYINLKYKS